MFGAMEEGQATADQCGEHGKLHLKTALDLSNKHSVMSFINLCSLKNNFEYFLVFLSDLLLCLLLVGGSQLLLCLSSQLHCSVLAAR